MSGNPWMDFAVLMVLLGPLLVRWPILLVLLLGSAAATFVSPDWSDSFFRLTVPAIFITLAGYVMAVFAKAVGVTD